ncbi:MAG: response regulator transcription factor [Anaerolineaceae bacterium]|nr:response regulator transcription factor [Anaerolineaceae bacterium]
MKTILLVEDNQDLSAVIRREMETEGYQIFLAEDGEKALLLHIHHRPDLIILDWMLPKLDGLTVLKKIRAESIVPILMLTARGDEIDRVLGLEVGADDYLTKPFSMRELIARVRALLRRIENVEKIIHNDQNRECSIINVGSLHLNPVSHQIKLEGNILDLTPKEFDLMHLFLQNPGRVFSRSYLLDTIWGSNYLHGDRSVDNAILRLRKKLSILGDEIEAVWGVGYRWRIRS